MSMGRGVGKKKGWGAIAVSLLISLPALLAPASASGQSTSPRDSQEATVTALAPGAAIRLDGDLSDPAWQTASSVSGFRQTAPNPGQDGTERTEVRLLLSDDALYVGFDAFDRDPAAIVGQVTRRDAESSSDRVHVILDSFRDGRTAFHFAVNPAGVKWDRYRFADTEEDPGWDPVWDVATRKHSEGWSAEFRIPLSQLRFDPQAQGGWGANFYREIARRNEVMHWAPIPSDGSAFVSRFGALRGVEGLAATRQIEILPYSLMTSEQRPALDAQSGVNFGADVKVGLPAGMTLDLTVNPDFGQVEADPGQINLSAFETPFPERRPFFLEGAGVFQMSLAPWEGSPDQLFYSRRIGGSPTLRPSDGGGRIEMDDQVSIISAAKLSGRTEGGWGLGFLGAVTGQEDAVRVLPAERESILVEPRSFWGVGRVVREFGEGRSDVGLMGTMVSRGSAESSQLGLVDRALSGAVDFRHRFGDDRFRVWGNLGGSHVSGDRSVIDALQRSPLHAYERPGMEHLYDPDRTALTGASWNGGFEKFAGGHFRFRSTLFGRTSGFEINDIGFAQETDFTQLDLNASWVEQQPGRLLRNWAAGLDSWNRRSLEQDFYDWSGVSAWFRGQLPNFWNFDVNMAQAFEINSRGVLRGGPVLTRGNHLWRGFNLSSDSRASVQGGLNTSYMTRAGENSVNWSISPNLRWRPSGRTTLSAGVMWRSNIEDAAWVGRAGEGPDRRWVVGRLDQTTTSLTLRVNHAFSPSMTLEGYAQPFISTGSYDRFREVVDGGNGDYSAQFAPLGVQGDRIPLPGSNQSVGLPDFAFRQMNANLVLRWEYRPGSTLFLVWSQGRASFDRDGRFDLGRETDALFDTPATNRLQAKMTWWFGG